MMSLAHSGSRLSLKNMTPVLPEGMILFPLDGRVQDTRNEIPVLLNTTTVRDDEKKFFSSIAVEDTTTNLVPNPSFEVDSNGDGLADNWLSWTGGNGDASRVRSLSLVPPLYGTGYAQRVSIVAQGNGNDEVLLQRVTGMEGKTYSASAYVRSNTTKVRLLLRFYDSNNNAIGSDIGSSTNSSTDKIERLSLTTTAPTGTVKIQVMVRGINAVGEWMEVDAYQLEALDHCTSFVDGSRGVGNLKYDISALGMRDAGCVSFWVYNSDAMVNNKVTNGISANNQYLVKLGSTSSDWYKDAVTIRVPSGSPRRLQFWTIKTQGTEEHILDSTTLLTGLGVGSWIHVVFQWDKNGLPSGNTKELYVNGKLEAYSNTTYLPQNILTYLHVGDWGDNVKLMPATLFEQLAIHPSKGFAPEVIENWYNAQAPFFDVKDQLFYW